MAFDPSAARPGSVFSTNPNYLGAWVVYINGLEVPCMGWQVDYGVWEVPSATIHMFPEKVLERLGHEDRVQVAIFYLDHWAGAPEFRLMFDGEIIGWSYSNFASQRSISFDCLAHIQIFQQLYFFFMQNVDNILAAGDPVVSATSVTQAGFSYPYLLFHQGLIGPPLTTGANGQPGATNTPAPTDDAGIDTEFNAKPSIQRPFDFVYNIVAGLISDQVPDERRSAPMVNFFARHVRKTRFQNRWVALPLLEDAERIANGQGAFPIFKAARSEEALNMLQNSSAMRSAGAGPVWNTIQQTLSTVFMEVGMIPTAPCVTVESLTRRILVELRTTDPLVDQHAAELISQGQQEQAAQSQLELQRAQATALLNSSLEVLEAVAAGAQGGPETPSTATTPTAATDTTVSSQLGTDTTTPVTLAQYFVKPQMFFGMPPLCNVFFPSMISGYTFSENYAQQPTRVYVNDSLMTQALQAHGNNAQFLLQALSVGWPEEADQVMRAAHGNVTTEGNTQAPQGRTNNGKNILLYPEELYKGPVVERMQIPAWFQLLMQMRNSVNNAEGSNTTAGVNNPGANPSAAPATAAPLGSIAALTPGAPPPVAAAPVTQVNLGDDPPVPPFTTYPTEAERNQHIALPRMIDGRLKLTMHGIAERRFALTRNGGLDPANYVGNLGGVKNCSFWPQEDFPSTPVHRGSNRAAGDARARARGLTPAAAPASDNETPAQKQVRRFARLIDFIRPNLVNYATIQQANLNEEQLDAVAFTMAYLVLSESGLYSIRNWNFGNFPQSRFTEPNPLTGQHIWTVQFESRIWVAFMAFRTAEEGLNYYLNRLLGESSNFRPALRVLLGQIPIGNLDGRLTGLMARQTRERRAELARLGVYPDDWFVALHFQGYSGDATTPDQHFAHAVEKFHFANNPRDGVKFYMTGVAPLKGTVHAVLSERVDSRVPPLFDPSLARLITTDQLTPAQRALRVSTVALGRSGNGTGQPATGASPGTTGPGMRSQDTALDGDDNQDGSMFSQLFRTYAQYEFFRSRYDKRRAVVQTAFNPYPVPGFPAVVFDKMTTEHHAIGYIMHVSQSAMASTPGSGSLQTSVQLSFCRTLNEFLYNVAMDVERFGSDTGSAPAEIIDEIREVVQDPSVADEFYRRLFYGSISPPHGAVFNFRNAMGFEDENGVTAFEVTAISVTDEITLRNRIRDSNAQQQDLAVENPTPPNPNTPTELHVSHNYDPNKRLVPLPHSPFISAFDSYQDAMKLVSRPICTLAQYIRFWHGGQPIAQLEERRVIQRGDDTYSYQSIHEAQITQTQQNGTTTQTDQGGTTRATAQVWEQIYRLKQGPGAPPDDAALHYSYSTGRATGQYTETGTLEPLPRNAPQTRADWQSALEFYRQVVRGNAPRQ